jgi:hypothetical protein
MTKNNYNKFIFVQKIKNPDVYSEHPKLTIKLNTKLKNK